MKKQIIILFSLTLMLCASMSAQEVFINEFTYDYEGQEDLEFVEIFGPTDTDLSGWHLWLYDGEKGSPYEKVQLSGQLSKHCEIEGKWYGVLSFSFTGGVLQNDAPDGMALVDKSETVVQFISYEGTFEAKEGPATGMTAVDIGVMQDDTTPKDVTIQVSEGTYILAPQTQKECNKGQSTTVKDSDCGAVVGCTEAINTIIENYLEENGSGGTGDDCKQWIGDCNSEGLIYRRGNVGIGTGAESHSKLSILSESGVTGGLFVEAVSSAIVATTSDGITIFAKTNTGSAIYGEASNEDGIAGEFQGNVEVNRGLLSINNATGDKSILVNHSGKDRFEVRNNGEVIVHRDVIVLTKEGHPEPIQVKVDDSTHDVFQVRNTGQINADAGIKINVTDDTEHPILVTNNGNVFKVQKDGKVIAGEIEVKMAPFGDYVFEKDYDLISLEDLQAYIQQHQHLPNIPSAKEVDSQGIGLGELSHLQMIKIEELTLYVLELYKKLQQVEHDNQALQAQLIARAKN